MTKTCEMNKGPNGNAPNSNTPKDDAMNGNTPKGSTMNGNMPKGDMMNSNAPNENPTYPTSGLGTTPATVKVWPLYTVSPPWYVFSLATLHKKSSLWLLFLGAWVSRQVYIIIINK
jgi:hypothetical protein